MNEIGRNVRTACRWEATARKAGNVHPFAEFDDLMYADFVRSADAIAPVFANCRYQPLGATILEAIRATRAVTSTNTNLGIVLLLAPLATAGAGNRLVTDVIGSATIADTVQTYEAIRLAVPGGLGRVEEQDVAAVPTIPLKEVMSLAADRDLIARQYADGFSEVLNEGLPALVAGWNRFECVEAAILTCQVRWLAAFPDSLIARKRGTDEAGNVQRLATAIEQAGGLATPAGRRLFADLDRWLRAEGHSRNPGTTADLVTACLFVALSEHRMNENMPFEFHELTQ